MTKTNLLLKILLLSITSITLSCSQSDDSTPSASPVAPTKPVLESSELAPIQKQNTLFKKFGSVQKFDWVPTGYQKDFVYDIYYYIPTSIQKTKDSPALVFMHGGGESTLTRDGSNKAVNIYIKEVVAAAEKYKFIAVLPSSNGLNWGGHTQRAVTELATLLRAHLNFDTNRLGLSGHSMGGMGITRSFIRIINDYSFVNSISSAMNDTTQGEDRLTKMYNIKYSHQLGTKDSFDTFIKWTKTLEQNVKDMEWNRRKTSMFELEWFDDGHVYGAAQTKKLESLFKVQRNIFQNELYGQIYFDSKSYVDNNITFTVIGTKRYLWVENVPTTISDIFNFEVKADKNRVDFNFYKDVDGYTIYPKSKTFKVYLSEKMFDLSKDINIYDEGYFVAKYKAKTKSDRKSGLMDKDDPHSAYDDVFEFKFN